MAVDPRNIRPGELCRLLNSTLLGEVISERQLRQHRTRAGLRVASVSDSSRVDLLRYAAWLAGQRHKPKLELKPKPDEFDGYNAHRERARARNIALSLLGRDIGQIPKVVDPERKARAETDFRFFCESYFPHAFTLAWSPDHLKVIAKIEQSVLVGGLFAMAIALDHEQRPGEFKHTLGHPRCIVR